jgi:hypothetical protein
MPAERIRTYREFWPFYVGQHLNETNRRLHYVGTLATLVCGGLAVAQSSWFFAAMPVCGYAFAWAGHFAFEKNRPATWTYPIWSLCGDFQMFALMSIGRMGAEIEKAAGMQRASPR